MSGSNRREPGKPVEWGIPLIGLCLAIGLAWGIGYLQSRETYSREQSAAAYKTAARDDAERSCIGTDQIVVFECVDSKVKAAYQTAHDEQDLSAQQRAASSALFTAVASFFALAISIVGIWYVKQTLDATLRAVEDTSVATEAMREANEIAREFQSAQLRAYVEVSSIVYGDGQIIVSDGNYIYVGINNIGTVPATIKKVHIACWCVILPDTINHIPLIYDDNETGAVLFGGKSAKIPFRMHTERIPKGVPVGIVLTGRIDYSDRFSTERFTKIHYAIANEIPVEKLVGGTRFTMANTWFDET